VWLHRECVRFWRKDHPVDTTTASAALAADDGLDLPAHLDRSKGNGPSTWVTPDRRPALGPPGDSLDDLK
jgi:hypothetical protein